MALGVAAGVAFWALEYFVENPVLRSLTGHYPDLSALRGIVGSPRMHVVALALNLVLAALGEELVWRGWILPRVTGLLGESRAAWGGALVLANAFVGLAHVYQD